MDIAHLDIPILEELRQMYSNNLKILQKQIASHGGELDAPIALINRAEQTKKDIEDIERGLRELGSEVNSSGLRTFPEEGIRARRTQDRILRHLGELPEGRHTSSGEIAQSLNIDDAYIFNNLSLLRDKGYITLKELHGSRGGKFGMAALKPIGRILLAESDTSNQ